VAKNPLDLPQLVHHLSERNYKFIVPVRDILAACKVRQEDLMLYIRTYFVLSKLHPDKLRLLGSSIYEEFTDLIMADEFISILKCYGVDVIKDSYNAYQVSKLLTSITGKVGFIFDAASEFENSNELLSRQEADT
jgi:hypothetical protein